MPFARMELPTDCIFNGGPDLEVLDSFLYRYLALLLGLGSGSPDLGIMLEYSQRTAQMAVLDVWSQNSFLEEYAQKMDLDLSLVLGKLLRENPSVPLNPAIFGHSAAMTRMPPLVFPLFPVSQRENEITIVSGVPGLNRLLQMRDFRCLNEFWGVERVNAVWAEPGHLREAIGRANPQISCTRDPIASVRDISNGGVPWIALDSIPPSDKINQWFSPALQRKYAAIPVYAGKRILTLAVARLLDPRLKAEIEGALRHRYTIQQVLAEEAALKRFVTASESRAINTSGIVQAMLSVERAGRVSENLEVIQADKLQQSSGRNREDEQAVIKFVHSILYKAVDMGASDIMFQEYPHRLRVRYKLDGDWFDEIGDFPGHISKQVISRIKVISGLEIQYVRLPQDGSFPIKIGDQRYDFRVNTSYHAQGEQAVLRLQRDHRSIRALPELGMPSPYAQAIGEMMNGDNGLLILCGPTGSGKTTTIYSILKSLDAVKNNILTAESPIEIFIENISQTQIDEDGPYDYAMWARGILRQAPDIVMMGEIRDEESVDALMRLSSSGHRAISTLHTNSVCEVPNRFFMFKAQPFMVADALKLAVSQRLVKKVCPRCYIEEPVPAKARLHGLGIDPEWLKGISALRRGRRCDFCRNTGVSGRKPIFEMLVVDDEVKVAIQERAPATHLKRLMAEKGENTLFEKAVREAGAGVISLEEACKFRDQSCHPAGRTAN
jgi:type II secretory ATPase GspE/PulE/Tfp pilus assembly ATPase PilB-like protein